jgi:hypothetical protein
MLLKSKFLRFYISINCSKQSIVVQNEYFIAHLDSEIKLNHFGDKILSFLILREKTRFFKTYFELIFFITLTGVYYFIITLTWSTI